MNARRFIGQPRHREARSISIFSAHKNECGAARPGGPASMAKFCNRSRGADLHDQTLMQQARRAVVITGEGRCPSRARMGHHHLRNGIAAALLLCSSGLALAADDGLAFLPSDDLALTGAQETMIWQATVAADSHPLS